MRIQEDNSPIRFNPDGSLAEEQSNLLLRNTLQRRVVSIDKKIERGTKRIDEAINKLKAISEFKVGDKLSVKEFNQKVQALNH